MVRFQAKGYAPDEKPVELTGTRATADGTLTRSGYAATGDAQKVVVAPGATTTIEITLTKE